MIKLNRNKAKTANKSFFSYQHFCFQGVSENTKAQGGKGGGGCESKMKIR